MPDVRMNKLGRVKLLEFDVREIKKRAINWCNCCGPLRHVGKPDFRQVIYGLHASTNNLILRVATVVSIVAVVSTAATRREDHSPLHAGHK